VQLPHEECESIRCLVDLLARRFSSTVPSFCLDADQDGVRAGLISLHCRYELEGVPWHDSVVVIRGECERWRVALAGLDVLER
jgi:hypothetical protein